VYLCARGRPINVLRFALGGSSRIEIVSKTTRVVDADGIIHIFATEDVKIHQVRGDGTAEVSVYYALKHYEGTVAPKEARVIPGYFDEEPLESEFLKELNRVLPETPE
jgi:biotin synthase-related radical SAM superfamily protein